MKTENTRKPKEPETAAPRVCLISHLNISQLAAWGSVSEFDDVIREIDNVNRIDSQRSRERARTLRATEQEECAESLSRRDCLHRWKEILQIVEKSPVEQLADRENHLNQLASAV